MPERVVITGLGVVSSIGCKVEEFWLNLINGKSGISRIESFDTSQLERNYGGEVKCFSPEFFPDSDKIKKFPRSHQFAILSSYLALNDSKIKETEKIGVTLGSIVAGSEYIENKSKNFSSYPVYMVAANLCNVLGLSSSVFTLSCACAAGNYAISLAYERIKCGQEQIVLAGGVDYFSLGTFAGLYRFFSIAPLKCQPFDKNRKGLIPAEGAGMLVLESLSSAKKRGAHIYAEILGYGTSCDAYHPVVPLEDGVYACMEDALRNSGLSINDIDYINAHGTGTVPNDKIECAAIKKLFGSKLYKKIPVSSIKSMLGHAMGAASSIEAISCCLTLQNGIIPPTINYETPDAECDIDCVPNEKRLKKIRVLLNNAFGFGGMNCSLALAKYEDSD
ncbi:MAG: beta-ketoacyl-[acyl-carrier-protein] synthase family protein [Candidatus Omnitrophota bacterium]